MDKAQAYKRFYELNTLIAQAQQELIQVVAIINTPEKKDDTQRQAKSGVIL